MSLTTKNWLADYIRDNKRDLLAGDIKLARVCGAPQGWTLSGYAWELETRGKLWGKLWRRIIDFAAICIFQQKDHCEKAYKKDTASSTVQ